MQSHRTKILTIPLKLLIAVLLIGLLFKLQHYPYTDILLTIGFLGIAMVYPIRFAYKNPKTVKDYLKLLLILERSLNGYFQLMHFGYSEIANIAASIAFFIWITLEVIDFTYYKKREYPFPRYWGVPLVSVVLIGLGTFLKLYHYPYAGFMLIAGYTLLAAWFSREPVNHGLTKVKGLFQQSSYS